MIMYASNHVAEYSVFVLYLQTCSSVAKERRYKATTVLVYLAGTSPEQPVSAA